MAITKKVLGAMITDNPVKNPVTGASDGGLSALLVPKRASALGGGLILGGAVAYNLGKSALQLHNNAKLGKVHYQGQLARLTSNYESNPGAKFTSGAGAAIYKALANGQEQLGYEMTEQVMRGPGLYAPIETYGVTPQFVSSIYGMGG